MRIIHLFCVLLLVSGLLLAYSNWLMAAKYQTLVWEAEDVQHLSGKAFKVEDYPSDPAGEVSGKKVLAVPKVPSWQKIAVDEVTYEVKIPETGTYYLWMRAFWHTDDCAPMLGVKVQGYEKHELRIGGDTTFDCLHWVDLCAADGTHRRPIRLKQGMVAITLNTHYQSGFKLDEFLLTNDKDREVQGAYKPTVPSVLVKDEPAKKK